MWKGEGLRRKDERCLNCAFQFRTEASGKSLSLSLSLSHVPYTQHGIRETLEAEQFKILEHRVTEVGKDNEIVHQVHRSNLWNNTYCRASNAILFLACIQKITIPTVIDFSSQGYHSQQLPWTKKMSIFTHNLLAIIRAKFHSSNTHNRKHIHRKNDTQAHLRYTIIWFVVVQQLNFTFPT